MSLPKDNYEFVIWKNRHKIHRTTIEIARDEDLDKVKSAAMGTPGDESS